VSTAEVPGRPLVPGYDWTLTITVSAPSAPFPSGVVLLAHVRDAANPRPLLATLSTGTGEIVRVSDTTVTVTIPGAVSERWAAAVIAFDLARTDTATPQYLGFRCDVPVVQPVTRP